MFDDVSKKEIIGKNLHFINSVNSSFKSEVTLNLGVFFLYGSWGKRACSTKIYVKMEIFTISGFGSSRRMWLCSLIGVIRQPLASYMSQIWSWDFCRGTSMYYVITKGGGESENGNFWLGTVLNVITREGKTPNLGYVIHGWSLAIVMFRYSEKSWKKLPILFDVT